MATIELFVGADNTTGLVDRELLGKILDSSHDSWTMLDAVGSWRGQREESVCVLISGDYELIMATARQIKAELRQDAVAFRMSPDLILV
jgi:hypothetical protein